MKSNKKVKTSAKKRSVKRTQASALEKAFAEAYADGTVMGVSFDPQPLRAKWNGFCYVFEGPEEQEIQKLKLENGRLRQENERLNSEAIEQAGLAQDAEFAMQEAEKDQQELKRQLEAWKAEALRLGLWQSAVDSRSVAFDYVSDLKTTVRTLSKFVN